MNHITPNLRDDILILTSGVNDFERDGGMFPPKHHLVKTTKLMYFLNCLQIRSHLLMSLQLNIL